MSEEETPEELPEDLPEQYVLTPEDVEDEAVRGDFVIRWAVILLGALLGCTALVESEPLMGVASGRWYAGNGWWPRVGDPFSFTAAGQAWANPHWLFDLFRAGVVAVGGWALLTVWTGAKVGGLVWTAGRCGVDGVSTWWGSVVLTLMLLACSPVLIPTPDLITPLCVAAALWVDRLAESKAKWRWAWMPLLVAQSNMDGHSWVTVVVIAALGVRAKAWAPTAAAAASLFVNPFPLETLIRPLEQHRYHYPELFAYGAEEPFRHYLLRPAWTPEFWTNLSLPAVAALASCIISLVCVLLGPASRGANVLVWSAATGLGVLCGHQWPSAAVVFAVLANRTGQAWYVAKFRQDYTTDWLELAWSRGGRGLTVLAVFLLAGLMITGRLGLADGRRVGLGLSDELEVRAVSARKTREKDSAERPLHFRLEQGDVLAYVGGRTAVDHRVELFAPSLTRQHRAARAAAVENRMTDFIADVKFDAAIPRLYGTPPDYASMFRLLGNGWRPQTLQAAGILLRPPGTTGVEPLSADALAAPTPPARPTWPLPPTGYDRFFNTPPAVSEDLLLSAHYGRLVQAAGLRPDTRTAVIRGATIGLHHGNAGLARQLDSPLGWEGVSDAYRILRLAEATAGVDEGLQELRFSQSLSALWQWSRCEPANALPHVRLFAVFAAAGRKDSAVLAGEEALRLDPDAPVDAEKLASIRESADAVRAEAEKVPKDDLLKRVNVALVGGCPRLAIEILEDDLTKLSGSPDAAVLLAGALVQAAEFERADAFLAVNVPTRTSRFLRYQTALSRADFAEARTLIEEYQNELPDEQRSTMDGTVLLLEVEAGDLEAAREIVRRILASPDDAAAARLAGLYAEVLGLEERRSVPLP